MNTSLTLPPDVPTLVSTLRNAIDSDQNLPFTGTLVADSGVTDLLTDYFINGMVRIEKAAVIPSADGKSAVATGLVDFGALACAATLTLTPKTQNLELALELIPSAGWTLSQAFHGVVVPNLTGLSFSSGGLLVCSGPTAVPGHWKPTTRGMTLAAALDLTSSFPLFAAITGVSSLGISGLVTDAQLPQMILRTDPVAGKLGPVSLSGLGITVTLSDLMSGETTTTDKQAIGIGQVAAQGTLSLNDTITGAITAALPQGGSPLMFDVAFTNVTLASLAELTPILGSINPLACLPSELQSAVTKAGQAFQLRSLRIAVDSANLAFRSVGIVAAIDLKGFSPFPSLKSIKIDDLIFQWDIAPKSTPPDLRFSAQANIELTKTAGLALGIQTQPDGGYTISIRQTKNSVLQLSDLAEFTMGLPLPELAVEDFSLSLMPQNKFYQMSVTILGTWSVLSDLGIALATVRVDVLYNGASPHGLSASITGTLSLAVGDTPAPSDSPWQTPPSNIDIVLTAIRSAGDEGWQLKGGVGPGQVVPVGDLITALARQFNVASAVPAPIQGLTIENLGLTFDTHTREFTFACQVDFDAGGRPVEVLVNVDVAPTAKGSKISFGALVLLGGLQFSAQMTTGAGPSTLVFGYQAPDGAGSVNVKDLIGHFLPDETASSLPDGLVVDLADATLAFLDKDQGKTIVFVMDVAVEFPLSDLPLVGNALPPDAKAGLRNMKVVVTSAPLSPSDVAAINAMAPAPVLPSPAAGTTGDAVPKGFSMVAEMELGELTFLLASPPPARPGAQSLRAAANSAEAQVAWVNVQKTFGPVAIQKVGFKYQDNRLYALANLSLTVSGLEISLIGLGMGSPLTNPALDFTIQGLGVSYTAGPVSVQGGMTGTLDPVDFTGCLSVRTSQLALAAFGSYAEYQDHPSFFLYGVCDTPLGGPPAFFVTGVAAGLGCNRKLTLPDVSGVATFPLVQWARGIGTPKMDPTKPVGDQVTSVLSDLAQAGVVVPSVGAFWFAAGIRFTSFQLVDSFALVTISTGADTEIALLGLSTATVPPPPATPVAEAQLGLKVSYSTASGLIAAAGQLTENSYVLSRSCRLTGGFAFNLWTTGEHAGEAVLTLGGYNPNFTLPDYYPVVPRLGMNWQVIPELAITGELYFAVTPNVIMAGGRVSAVWHSGPIKAWFTYWADFLMTFEPFHYYVDGGIDLGASFTIDLWLTSISMTIHVGVELALWGPEFAGHARIDLSIISFTISFNDHGQATNTTIGWGDFVERLLPPSAPAARTALRGTASVEDPAPTSGSVVQINVTSGLIRPLETLASGPSYLVNAETFQCSVLTFIPAKEVIFNPDSQHDSFVNLKWAPDDQQPCDDNGHPIQPCTDFGVGPVGIASADFQPSLTLSLDSQQDSVLLAVRCLTNSPKALWETKTYDNHGVPQVDPQSALTDASIPNALVGLDLIPHPVQPDILRPVPLAPLLFSLDDDIQTFAWSPGRPPAPTSFADPSVAGTITNPSVAGVRARLLDVLEGLGVTVNTTLDVSGLADPSGNDLQAESRMRLLGAPDNTVQTRDRS